MRPERILGFSNGLQAIGFFYLRVERLSLQCLADLIHLVSPYCISGNPISRSAPGFRLPVT